MRREVVLPQYSEKPPPLLHQHEVAATPTAAAVDESSPYKCSHFGESNLFRRPFRHRPFDGIAVWRITPERPLAVERFEELQHGPVGDVL